MTDSSPNIKDTIFQPKATGRLLVIGDSRVENGFTFNLRGWASLHQRGPFNWFQALTSTSMEIVHFVRYSATAPASPSDGVCAGIGSTLTVDALTNLKANVLDRKPNIVAIISGTNDVSAGLDVPTITYNLNALVEQCNNVGAFVWLFTIDPRNTSSTNGFNTIKEAARLQVNEWIREQGRINPYVQVIDVDTILKASEGVLATDNSYDGLHWNSMASYKIAEEGIIPAYQAYVGSNVRRKYIMPGNYDAVTRPFGNMINNSAFTGGAGTTTAGGATDTKSYVPTSWKVERLVNGSETLTGSALTKFTTSVEERLDANGKLTPFIRIDYTSSGERTSDDEAIRIRTLDTAQANSNFIDIGYVLNQWYKGQLEIQIAPGSPSGLVRSVCLEVGDRDTGGTITTFVRHFERRYTNAPNSRKDLFPNQINKSLVLQTPPVQAVGNRFTYYIYLDFDTSIVGSGTFYIGNPLLNRTPHFPDNSFTRRLRILDNITGAPRVIKLEGTTLTAGLVGT